MIEDPVLPSIWAAVLLRQSLVLLPLPKLLSVITRMSLFRNR